ncbi:MAG: S-layer homology domain-containing protein [Micrococcus sp.]|nr:S-layer homology domain-containing protein [Micrococcus sp.]
MSRHAHARPANRGRILATALSLGLLLPGVAVATPAAADSEILNPLDQATEFDQSLPVLDESVLESLQDPGAAGPSPEGTVRSGRHAAPAATAHLGPCKQDFIDAPPKGSFYDAITWMACEGITAGNGSGHFGKTREITRGETAQFLYKYSGERHVPGTTDDAFTDAGPGDPYFTAISWMKENGYTSGQANGAFGTDQRISRGQLAQFMYKASGVADYEAPARSPFTDSGPGSAFYTAAAWLQSTRLVAGYGDGTFRTGRDIVRGETAQFLYGLETYLNGKPAPPATAPKPAPTLAPAPAPKPAPAPEIPLAYRYVVIADDGLNVRRSPGTQHPKVTSLLRNAKVVITGRSQVAGGATWREIIAGEHRGWVHGGYIIKDFELGNAKSALARTGTLRKPTTRNGVTVLDTTWEAQPNGYWCGPASIKIALEGFGIETTQAAMAKEAQTDRDGTWLHQVARVLDYNAPTDVRYSVTTIRGQDSTEEDRIRIRENLKRSIKAGVPAVVNIAATPDEQPPLQRQKTGGRFTLRHHMPIVGYNENNNTVLVQDPWTKPFWISVYQLADMAGTRGYASLK